VGVANSRFASAAAVSKISAVTLAVDGQIDFQNIPQTFRHLWMVGAVLKGAGGAAILDEIDIRFNADGGFNYWNEIWQAFNAVTSSGNGGAAKNRSQLGRIFNTAGATGATELDVLIFEYTNPTIHKIARSRCGYNNDAGPQGDIMNGHTRWLNVAAVNRITLLGLGAETDLRAGTTVTLYGLT
jgi:hypothetical protein